MCFGTEKGTVDGKFMNSLRLAIVQVECVHHVCNASPRPISTSCPLSVTIH
jgi:hypothetical protein